MKHLKLRLVLSVLLLNGISFVLLWLNALLRFPAHELLPNYLWSWTFSKAAVTMVDTFIPVTLTAVLLAFSFLFTPQHRSDIPTEFHRVIGPSVAVFIFFIALYTLLAEGFAPGLRVRMEEYRGNSSFAEISLREGDRLVRRQRMEEAIIYYDYYLSIDPANEEVEKKREDALANLELEPITAPSPEDDVPEHRERLLEQDAGDLIDSARNFLRQRDYYSAHYYAGIALQIDPQREEARRIAAEARSHIDEADFSRESALAGELFSRKREAYNELTRGNTIRAYYLFRKLAEEYPRDPEIADFSRIAREEVKNESFFIDELEHANPFPGRHSIFFVNPIPEHGRELVFFERFIPMNKIAYVNGIEIMGLDQDGKVEYHLSAPVGKITEIGTESGEDSRVTLMLRAIDRRREGRVYEPEYLRGKDRIETKVLRPLSPSVGEIPGFSMAESSLRLQYIHELLSQRPRYDDHGFLTAAIDIELVMRLMRPFGLLIFGTLSIALGWALRVRGRRRWYHYLLLPVLPPVIFILSDLFLYVNRLMYLFFVLQAGFALTLSAMIFIQAFLFGAALVITAGQRT